MALCPPRRTVSATLLVDVSITEIVLEILFRHEEQLPN